MKIKQGVKIRPDMAMGMMWVVVDSVFRRVGVMEAVVTSVCDGRHMLGSKHYEGLAADFRISHVFPGSVPKIVSELKADLGAEFDVVLEKDHIHVEYDPK